MFVGGDRNRFFDMTIPVLFCTQTNININLNFWKGDSPDCSSPSIGALSRQLSEPSTSQRDVVLNTQQTNLTQLEAAKACQDETPIEFQQLGLNVSLNVHNCPRKHFLDAKPVVEESLDLKTWELGTKHP